MDYDPTSYQFCKTVACVADAFSLPPGAQLSLAAESELGWHAPERKMLLDRWLFLYAARGRCLSDEEFSSATTTGVRPSETLLLRHSNGRFISLYLYDSYCITKIKFL